MAQSDDKTILAVKQQFSIVGNSSALNSAIERALKVAPFDLSVLIIGESGSGKEFFPQIIHKYSKRKPKRNANFPANSCFERNIKKPRCIFIGAF